MWAIFSNLWKTYRHTPQASFHPSSCPVDGGLKSDTKLPAWWAAGQLKLRDSMGCSLLPTGYAFKQNQWLCALYSTWFILYEYQGVSTTFLHRINPNMRCDCPYPCFSCTRTYTNRNVSILSLPRARRQKSIDLIITDLDKHQKST